MLVRGNTAKPHEICDSGWKIGSDTLPKLTVNEPQVKEMRKLWLALDRYTQMLLGRPHPVRFLGVLSELKMRSSEKWTQSELDSIVDLLMKDIEKSHSFVTHDKRADIVKPNQHSRVPNKLLLPP
jgi:hypothetical protein